MESDSCLKTYLINEEQHCIIQIENRNIVGGNFSFAYVLILLSLVIWFLYVSCRLCLGAWSDHGERTGGFYACNRYEAAKQEGVVRILLFPFAGSENLFFLFAFWKTSFLFLLFIRVCIVVCSMMKLREEEKWQRILWRDTLIIMNAGLAINWYSEFSFQIFVCVCSAML